MKYEPNFYPSLIQVQKYNNSQWLGVPIPNRTFFHLSFFYQIKYEMLCPGALYTLHFTFEIPTCPQKRRPITNKIKQKLTPLQLVCLIKSSFATLKPLLYIFKLQSTQLSEKLSAVSFKLNLKTLTTTYSKGRPGMHFHSAYQP